MKQMVSLKELKHRDTTEIEEYLIVHKDELAAIILALNKSRAALRTVLGFEPFQSLEPKIASETLAALERLIEFEN